MGSLYAGIAVVSSDRISMDVACGDPGDLTPYANAADASSAELPLFVAVDAERDVGNLPSTTASEEDECNRNDNGSCEAPQLPLSGAMQPLARHPKCRSHYGGLLYHHRFPSAGRTKRKVLWAAPSAATLDSSAQDFVGGGKIRVSEERVSRQLQQLRLVGAAGATAEAQPSAPVGQPEPNRSSAPTAADGGLWRYPAAATVVRSGRRSTGSSPFPQLPKLRAHEQSSSLPQFATTDSCRLMPLASVAAAASGSRSPISWSWAMSQEPLADEEISMATSSVAVISPPVVVWETEELRGRELPAPTAEPAAARLPPQPACPAATVSCHVECPTRDVGLLAVGCGKLPGQLPVSKNAPTLQVPLNPVERSSSPPPSALINPDEEGICVVLSVSHCASAPGSMEH